MPGRAFAAAPSPAPSTKGAADEETDTFDDRIPLEEEVENLRDELEALKEHIRQKEEQPIRRDVSVTLSGYTDFGFFVPQGNGSGVIQDYGNALFPQYAGRYGWVFLGDLLAPTVNSRGEAADLGKLPGVNRFDSVHSRGAPGFILNESNLTLRVGYKEQAILTTSLNFVPRTGSDFGLGDFFDLDLAQLEWVLIDAPTTSIFVGKIEPTFGIEYKQRKANQRFGITPSLAARYTTGTQLGLKVRTKLLDEHLILAVAITNGSSTVEQFHFYDEVDSNAGKTATGRAAFHLPIDPGGTLEVGVSGEVGPQDRARDDSGLFWLVGADAEYARAGFSARAEWMRGGSPGRGNDVYALDLKTAGYVEVDWMVLPMIGVLGRADLRDAFVSLGTERAYLTKGWRATGGLRWVITEHFVLKGEYLHNGTFGGIPRIRDDVFTSSFVVSY